MSKRTVALIIVLFVITAVLIVLAVYPITNTTNKSITPSPTANSQAQTVLVFAPPQKMATTSAMPDYSMDVNVLTGKDKINAVQLELSYDPSVLTNVNITPGAFFQNPVVLLKNVDQSLGRISYAIALPPGTHGRQGSGTVAQITFTSLAKNDSSTTLKFLPKTQVTAEGVSKSVLKSTIDSTFVGAALSSPTAKLNPATGSAQ